MIMDGLTDPVLQYIRDQLLLQGRLIYVFFKLRPGGGGAGVAFIFSPFSAHNDQEAQQEISALMSVIHYLLNVMEILKHWPLPPDTKSILHGFS